MFIIVTFLLLFTNCAITNSEPKLQKWLDIRSNIFSVPIKYMIHLEPEDPIFRKIKRSVTEDIKTEETVITNTEIITNDKNGDRNKRTINNNSSNRKSNQGPNLNVKAGLRYHHQQRHTNGSVSGSYATLDPKGSLQVMHYVSDDKGYREYPEVGEPGSQASAANHYFQFQPRQLPNPPAHQPNIEVVSNGNVGNQAINPNQNGSSKSLNNRRDVNPIGDDHFNFVPNIASPYNLPSPASLGGGGSPPTQILQSAVISVGQYGPRSPLFHKYYRPSPEEVQRSYDYHRLRSGLDPGSFRPPEANLVPDVVRDKPMQVTGVYSQYQPPPYQVRYQDETPNGYYVYNTPPEDTRYYNVPQYAPPRIPIDAQAPIPPPQELYPRQQPPDLYPNQPPPNYFGPPVNQQFQQPYPENPPAQPPLYFQAFDQQAFPPGQDAYPPGQQAIPQFQDAFPPGQQGLPPLQPAFPPPNSFAGPAPYVSNNAMVNQPYPANVPIYDAPAPPNIPTYSQPPPNSIPIYNQQYQIGPGPAPGFTPGPGPAPGFAPGPGPVPAPVYAQPPPNNIPIYDPQQIPPGNVQNMYYASGSTPQPKIAVQNAYHASGSTPQPKTTKNR
ncbi:uncharacterized protein LOC135844622 [Planococcus citri]|uniref:uncharacterized protein LOC135844622 n=1 Tax=Planococcus citri TaxID=170843 RepID=UPI0031FA1649